MGDTTNTAEKIGVEILCGETRTDPALKIYTVELSVPKKGIWRETVGSEADLRTFLKGVRAGAGMAGGTVELTEIPMNPSFILAKPSGVEADDADIPF